jgi:uncharacterized membrane protein
MKLAVMLWMMIGTTLAGVLVVAVLMVPSLQPQAKMWIAVAAAVGAVIGFPISMQIAKAIERQTQR